MNQQLFSRLSNLSPEEFVLVQRITQNMTESQQQQFVSIYGAKRKDQQLLLILAILGFVGVAGVHRFLVGNIIMGLLYFFTGGLCLIGTIVDIINIKDITFEYNQKQALEAATMVSMMK